MKKHFLTTLILVALLISQSLLSQEARPWYQDGPWHPPVANQKAKILPLIKVKGNKFVNAKGDTLLFRGLSISDPDKIERQGHWNKSHFEKIKEMGCMVVRIPVHPVAWRERTPEKYLELLDQAADWCTDLGMYIIIDWHSIGNLGMELFQDPMYNTTKSETYRFWRTISQHFAGNNTVAFYELFNEPTIYRGQLGTMPWSDWKKICENMIGIIRAFDAEKIPLVAGLDWAYDLSPLRDDPVNAEGIAYVTHPYSFKRNQPWEPKWEEDFGFAAGRYPIVATEFGYEAPPGQTNDNEYGKHIIKYLEGNGISWICWCFDPEWGPRLIKSWQYDLTGSGEFFKAAFNQQKDLPKKK